MLSWRANLSQGFKFLLDSRTMDSYHLTDGEVLYLIAQRKPLATYLAGGRYEEIGLLYIYNCRILPARNFKKIY